MNFPSFRPNRTAKPNSAQPVIPLTPSFGLFLPTPIPASSNLASPYLSSPCAVLPYRPLAVARDSRNPGDGGWSPLQPISHMASIGAKPRYSLQESVRGEEGTIIEGGLTPRVVSMKPAPKQSRPLPPQPNPFDKQDCTAFSHLAQDASPPLARRANLLAGHSAPLQSKIHIPITSQARLPNFQPGQLLPTSSTVYCRQIQDMSRNPPPVARPTGPRRLYDFPSGPATSIGLSRGPSRETVTSSEAKNVTDLRRRSALKSLPPTRDYSSSSNRSNRLSLLSAINQSPTLTGQILPTHNLVESPPQVDFIPDMAEDANVTLSWESEAIGDDEAMAVWRRLERKMGRRMHSGLEQQRGRWVVTPAASPMPGCSGGVEMSPGQFSVSDYMAFGEAYEGRLEVDQPVLREAKSKSRGTPYPRSTGEVQRSLRAESRQSFCNNRTPTTACNDSVLDSLDQSLFPTFQPNPKPTVKPVPIPKAASSKPKRNTLCRLDTQVISALESLKSNWDSPDLDLALLGKMSQNTSPATPASAVAQAPLSTRPLPLPSLTRSSASPPNEQLRSPLPLPRPPLPPSPLEKGLGLGMSLGTTYNLPSKNPSVPLATPPPRQTSRPLPAPSLGLSRKATIALSRKSTMRVEKVTAMEGLFVIRDLDTGEALEVGVDGLEAALVEMASRS